MPNSPRTLDLKDDAATTLLGERIAKLAGPGRVVLLSGDIGAGKSHLARAAIRHLIGPDEDVPSPTFTLVQTYDGADFEIWHADLYRLTDPSEVEELGLTEAFERHFCIVEWPDRMGTDLPEDALHLLLEHEDHGASRRVSLLAPLPDWSEGLIGG